MFLFVVNVYTSRQVSECRCGIPYWRGNHHNFDIRGWKENKSIHSHTAKLSYVRVEATYDYINFRLNTRGQSSKRRNSVFLQAGTHIAPSKRRQNGECITNWGLILRQTWTYDNMYGSPCLEPSYLWVRDNTECGQNLLYTLAGHVRCEADVDCGKAAPGTTPSFHREDGEFIANWGK